MSWSVKQKPIKGRRLIRYEDGQGLYCLGKHTYRNLTVDANAIIKVINENYLDMDRFDAYIEKFRERRKSK